MKEEILRKFLDKEVVLVLEGKWHYHGKIEAINEDILEFRDKRGKFLAIHIEKIKEVIEK